MPTYVYGLASESQDKGCDFCRENFETVQKMSENALTKCPRCGSAIERRILAHNVSNVEKLKGPSDKKMAQGGFTQYKKKGKGYYEKSFGKGPQTLGGSGQF